MTMSFQFAFQKSLSRKDGKRFVQMSYRGELPCLYIKWMTPQLQGEDLLLFLTYLIEKLNGREIQFLVWDMKNCFHSFKNIESVFDNVKFFYFLPIEIQGVALILRKPADSVSICPAFYKGRILSLLQDESEGSQWVVGQLTGAARLLFYQKLLSEVENKKVFMKSELWDLTFKYLSPDYLRIRSKAKGVQWERGFSKYPMVKKKGTVKVYSAIDSEMSFSIQKTGDYSFCIESHNLTLDIEISRERLKHGMGWLVHWKQFLIEYLK